MTDLERWKAQNPLRAWRMSHKDKPSQESVARTIRVTSTTVALWERGAMMPADHRFDDLILIIGDGDLKNRWEQWYRSAPTITIA